MGIIVNVFLLGFAGTVTVLFAVLYVFLTWYYDYWSKRGVPNVKPRFPFGNLGDLMMQRTSTIEYFAKMHKYFEGHPLAGYISIWEPVLLVRDPELIKQMLVKDFTHFHDRGVRFHEDSDPLVAHLFNLSGKRWVSLRQKLSPTFTSGKMRYMFPLIKKCAEEFHQTVKSEIVKNGNEIEMKEMNARYTTDVIGSTAFGVDAGSLSQPDAEMRVIGREILSSEGISAAKNFIFFLSPRLSEMLRLKLIKPHVEKTLMKIVSDTINYREKNNIERNDFLQLLIRLKNTGTVDDEKGKAPDVELTVTQMCAQAFVFFVAGFETSATTMTFCLYELARNPSIQLDLANEVDRILEEYNGEITYEGLMKMHLMDRVIAETLRLYPAVPILFRECTKEYVIKKELYPNLLPKDLIIEKGTKVIFPSCGLHTDPKYFPDPERFDPERFTEEVKKQRPTCTYLPFGEGPRFCIGNRFGSMQTKAGLATLLSNFELRLGKKSTGQLRFDPTSFVPSVKEGIFIQFYLRKKEK